MGSRQCLSERVFTSFTEEVMFLTALVGLFVCVRVGRYWNPDVPFKSGHI